MSHYIDTQTVSVNRNYLYSIIKNFRVAFPKNFDKSGLTICKKCEGSGLPIKPNQQSISFWQSDEYCSECGGFGVKGIEKIYNKYLCVCKGRGCKICEGRGTVDWITHAMKKTT